VSLDYFNVDCMAGEDMITITGKVDGTNVPLPDVGDIVTIVLKRSYVEKLKEIPDYPSPSEVPAPSKDVWVCVPDGPGEGINYVFAMYPYSTIFCKSSEYSFKVDKGWDDYRRLQG
jgi:hypothetical protein